MVVKTQDYVLAEENAARDSGIQKMVEWAKTHVPLVHRVVVCYVPPASKVKKSRSKKVVKK